MKTKATEGSKLSISPIPEIFERRPFAVRALTLLLFVQGTAFLILSLSTIEWQLPYSQLIWQYAPELSYLLMGLLNLYGAIGFIRLRAAAWLMATVVQGLYLLLTLVIYVVNRPDDNEYAFYGLMALSVIIVIYLNYAEVPTLFLRWRTPDHSSRLAARQTRYYENFSGQID